MSSSRPRPSPAVTIAPFAAIAALGVVLLALAPTGCTEETATPGARGPASAPSARSPWLAEGEDVPLFVDRDPPPGEQHEDLEDPLPDDPAMQHGPGDGHDHDVPEEDDESGMSMEEARQRGGRIAADPLGGCRIDLEKGRVVIDAMSLFKDGPFLELFACTDRGKTHESLFMAFVAPDKLHLALLALGAEPVAEVAHFGEVRALEKAPRLGVTVEWENAKGETVRRLAEDLLYDRYRRESMPRVGWAFSGSRFVTIPAGYEGPTEKKIYAGIYMGSILTVFHDPDAVIDNPLLTGGDDQTYLPFADRMPPRHTECRLIFERWDEKLHGAEADPQARGTLGDVAEAKKTFPSVAPAAISGPIGGAVGAVRRGE